MGPSPWYIPLLSNNPIDIYIFAHPFSFGTKLGKAQQKPTKMDVFISEEYVVKRRVEKKAAAAGGNGKSSSMASESSAKRSDEERRRKARPNHDHDVMVSSGLSDGIVFSCFSA